ncbi:TMEM165/GDT1 family protein [Pelistega sp. NLN82]|uniref:GDT1 family protein n=1 Tax=Pelistega ratti TaxID=2652177 RepID=A0A6L9Y4N0_9BURK|nr:TMEM165/GDT1 family protein [Pelistega ratti]NEN74738.1 TMEM165/GDT1 family protein [Pelistega ratti]
MNAFLISSSTVALAEMGDKTQLLAFLLASRFKRPIPIILGITLATLINHGFAGSIGAWLSNLVSPDILRWILGISFIAMAIWMLIPDKLEAEKISFSSRFGVFGVTCLTFFLAEMGDKTQIATIAMAARFDQTALVILGTTAGMLIANIPSVFLGEKFAHHFSPKLIHTIAASIFILLGIATLFEVDKLFGGLF